MFHFKWLFSLLLLSLSSVSMAGFYIGGNIGSANTDDPSGLVDDDDTGYKIYIGAEVNQNFAVEGYYASFGEPSVTVGPNTATTEISGIGIDAIGKLPVGSSSKLFASIGIFNWDEEYSVNGVTNFEDDGTDLKVGIGFQHSLSQAISLRLEYEAFYIQDSFDDIDVTMFSAGLQINF